MRSYAAGRWAILWKVRVPASLPYIFSALKIAATASVVGAIIGELPSGLQSGLGGAILNFNQYYSLEPQELWATNIVAAALGIVFFLAVVLAEQLVVRRAPEHARMTRQHPPSSRSRASRRRSRAATSPRSRTSTSRSTRASSSR